MHPSGNRRMRRSRVRRMCRPPRRCPRQESNLDLPLRRRPSCPLDYEGAGSEHTRLTRRRRATRARARRPSAAYRRTSSSAPAKSSGASSVKRSLDERALVDGVLAELGGGDRAALDERRAPDERHRATLALAPRQLPTTSSERSSVPVGVALGGLLGEVGVGGEVALVAPVGAGDEAHVAVDLVAALASARSPGCRCSRARCGRGRTTARRASPTSSRSAAAARNSARRRSAQRPLGRRLLRGLGDVAGDRVIAGGIAAGRILRLERGGRRARRRARVRAPAPGGWPAPPPRRRRPRRASPRRAARGRATRAARGGR